MLEGKGEEECWQPPRQGSPGWGVKSAPPQDTPTKFLRSSLGGLSGNSSAASSPEQPQAMARGRGSGR